MSGKRRSRGRKGWVCTLTALTVACARTPAAREEPRNDAFGSPEDVRTEPGAKRGFIVGTCDLAGFRAFYVEGSGSAFDAGPIVPAVGGSMSGRGMGCKGMGRIHYVFSWRQVDPLIEAVGRSLAMAGSREVVTIVVSAEPTVH